MAYPFSGYQSSPPMIDTRCFVSHWLCTRLTTAMTVCHRHRRHCRSAQTALAHPVARWHVPPVQALHDVLADTSAQARPSPAPRPQPRMPSRVWCTTTAHVRRLMHCSPDTPRMAPPIGRMSHMAADHRPGHRTHLIGTAVPVMTAHHGHRTDKQCHGGADNPQDGW